MSDDNNNNHSDEAGGNLTREDWLADVLAHGCSYVYDQHFNDRQNGMWSDRTWWYHRKENYQEWCARKVQENAKGANNKGDRK